MSQKTSASPGPKSVDKNFFSDEEKKYQAAGIIKPCLVQFAKIIPTIEVKEEKPDEPQKSESTTSRFPDSNSNDRLSLHASSKASFEIDKLSSKLNETKYFDEAIFSSGLDPKLLTAKVVLERLQLSREFEKIKSVDCYDVDSSDEDSGIVDPTQERSKRDPDFATDKLLDCSQVSKVQDWSQNLYKSAVWAKKSPVKTKKKYGASKLVELPKIGINARVHLKAKEVQSVQTSRGYEVLINKKVPILKLQEVDLVKELRTLQRRAREAAKVARESLAEIAIIEKPIEPKLTCLENFWLGHFIANLNHMGISKLAEVLSDEDRTKYLPNLFVNLKNLVEPTYQSFETIWPEDSSKFTYVRDKNGVIIGTKMLTFGVDQFPSNLQSLQLPAYPLGGTIFKGQSIPSQFGYGTIINFSHLQPVDRSVLKSDPRLAQLPPPESLQFSQSLQLLDPNSMHQQSNNSSVSEVDLANTSSSTSSGDSSYSSNSDEDDADQVKFWEPQVEIDVKVDEVIDLDALEDVVPELEPESIFATNSKIDQVNSAVVNGKRKADTQNDNQAKKSKPNLKKIANNYSANEQLINNGVKPSGFSMLKKPGTNTSKTVQTVEKIVETSGGQLIKAIQCPFCPDNRFVRSDVFSNHLEKIHKKKAVVEIPQNSAKSSQLQAVVNPFSVTDNSFPNRINLVQNKQSNTLNGIKTFPTTIPILGSSLSKPGAVFNNGKDFLIAQNPVVSGAKANSGVNISKCAICSKNFLSAYLQDHMTRSHPSVVPIDDVITIDDDDDTILAVVDKALVPQKKLIQLPCPLCKINMDTSLLHEHIVKDHGEKR